MLAGCASSGTGETGDSEEPNSAATTIESVADQPLAGDTSTTVPADAPGRVLRVPDSLPTIQSAVDAANPGDLVLVAPGTYREGVDVVTDGITIRGLDRRGVVLDGEFERPNGIRVLGAADVTVENLTVTNFTDNGVYWTGATGYRGSYIDAIRNLNYGIYAFDSVGGRLEHSYASGSGDAGVYVGQCFPCSAVVEDVIAEHNGLGYSGTNAGGDLYIVNSVFRNNRVGMLPNSGTYELCYPQRATTIAGNLVHSNNQPDTPANPSVLLVAGNGILVQGGIDNLIQRNRVLDHDRTGIALVTFPEPSPNDDMPTVDDYGTTCADQRAEPLADDPPPQLFWESAGNRVIGNVVQDSRIADLAVDAVDAPVEALGNCFDGNEYTTAAPSGLAELADCDAPVTGDWSVGAIDIRDWYDEYGEQPPPVALRDAVLPSPPELPGLTDPENAPWGEPVDVSPTIDLDSIGVPPPPRSPAD